jgi:hypothetical protein
MGPGTPRLSSWQLLMGPGPTTENDVTDISHPEQTLSSFFKPNDATKYNLFKMESAMTKMTTNLGNF